MRSHDGLAVRSYAWRTEFRESSDAVRLSTDAMATAGEALTKATNGALTEPVSVSSTLFAPCA